MVVVNTALMMVKPILLASHPAVWALWGCIASTSVATSHSGYAFLGAEKHDMHHLKFHCNYGVAGYIGDRLMGSFMPEAPAKINSTKQL